MRVIGVDIGGTSIKCALLDEKGTFYGRFSFRTNPLLGSDAILESLGAQINQMLFDHRVKKEEVVGIGVGCPGNINSETGVCDYANNLKWFGVPLAAILSKSTSIPVKIANDANAAMLGEVRFGVVKRYRSVVLLTLGTGVGGGLYLDGKIYGGNEGKGAELGHSLLVMDGRKCSCGRLGCLEAYTSVKALVKDTQEAMQSDPKSLMWSFANNQLSNVNGRTAFECAKMGDGTAKKVVDQYIHFLGEGCLNFMNIFRPDAIVLGGGLSGQKEALTEPLKAYVAARGYGFGDGHSPAVDIVVSNLGNDAGVLGAAALFLSEGK